MVPDKIYVREYQDGDYTTWWDEKPHEEESIGMKAVCFFRKDTLLDWLEPLEKEYRERSKQGEMVSQIAGTYKQIIDKLNSM